MHEASKLRPVVIDESLIDLESLRLAREMGYTGAALKACKGQTQSLLMAAAAQKYGMFLCVQDLTCPGASLIHSAGLAAHVPGVAAIEANAAAVLPGGQRAVGGPVPRHLPHHRRDDGDRAARRAGAGGGPVGAAMPGGTKHGRPGVGTQIRVPCPCGGRPWSAPAGRTCPTACYTSCPPRGPAVTDPTAARQESSASPCRPAGGATGPASRSTLSPPASPSWRCKLAGGSHQRVDRRCREGPRRPGRRVRACTASTAGGRRPSGRRPLVVATRAALGQAGVVERSVRKLLEVRGRTIKGDPEVQNMFDIDPKRVGWPWAEGTSPGSSRRPGPCLALRAAGQGTHPRSSRGLQAAARPGVRRRRHQLRQPAGPRPDDRADPRPDGDHAAGPAGRTTSRGSTAAVQLPAPGRRPETDLEHLGWAKLALDLPRPRPGRRGRCRSSTSRSATRYAKQTADGRPVSVPRHALTALALGTRPVPTRSG